jgi:4-hydroxy-tetrahydrodipicolinate reductase
MIRICVAGATGWAGRAVTEAILRSTDFQLTGAIARTGVGSDLGSVLGTGPVGVLIDYTSHDRVRENTLAAIRRGVAVVIGSSGLTRADFDEIDALARTHRVGVVAAGNFSITAAMAQAAAVLVARHLPNVEIIDFAAAEKPDAPSGTARELAERLAATIRSADGATAGDAVPMEAADPLAARGTTVDGIHVHSVRLPSFSVSTEIVFGLADERLVIRHDAGQSADPYVRGTLMAARMVTSRVGLTRGLDTLLGEGNT